MNWHEWAGPALTWLAACAMAVWSYARTHRDQLSRYADIAIGIVEKYLAGAPEEEMEAEAIRIVLTLWPGLRKRKRLTSFLVRSAVREACRRRRFLAEHAGLRKATE